MAHKPVGKFAPRHRCQQDADFNNKHWCLQSKWGPPDCQRWHRRRNLHIFSTPVWKWNKRSLFCRYHVSNSRSGSHWHAHHPKQRHSIALHRHILSLYWCDKRTPILHRHQYSRLHQRRNKWIHTRYERRHSDVDRHHNHSGWWQHKRHAL